MDTIHPESADIFNLSSELNAKGQSDIVSLSDDSNTQVWSFEYEQYVSPSDFTGNAYAN